MATIHINAEDIQTFLDDGSYKVVGVEWNKYGVGEPTVELEITKDLVYEDDDYVEVKKYDEVKRELDQAKEELETTKYELETADELLEQATALADTEIANLKLEIEVLNQKLAIKPWYTKIF